MALPAVPESIPAVRHAVANYVGGCCGDLSGVLTAVSEAVTNAVMHAYRDDVPGEVRVEGRKEGRRLVVSVSDDGVGMKPNPASQGLGLGSTLIAAMSDEVTYASPGRGVRVLMHFPCGDGAGPS